MPARSCSRTRRTTPGSAPSILSTRTALWISTVVDPRDGTELPVHEIFHGRTGDAGESLTWTPVTEGSATANFRPIAVPGDPSREVLAWYRGTMQSSQAYDTEVLVRVAERRRE